MDRTLLNGMSIIIVPLIIRQRKKHKKKRINKKWAKRYGVTRYCALKDGDVLMAPEGMYMNKVTYEALQLRLMEEKKRETTKEVDS